MDSLSTEELDDPEMVIIPVELDTASSEVAIDDSITNYNVLETCGDPKIRESARTIGVLSNTCEDI